MILDTEKKMSKYLDDLLIANGLENQRQENQCFIITKNGSHVAPSRVNTRVKVRINSTECGIYNKFVSVSYKDETCNFDLITLQPTHECTENGIPKSIRKIMPHIRATLKKHKSELAECAHNANQLRFITSSFSAEKNKVKY